MLWAKKSQRQINRELRELREKNLRYRQAGDSASLSVGGMVEQPTNH